MAIPNGRRMTDPTLTTGDVAELLGVSREFVLREIKACRKCNGLIEDHPTRTCPDPYPQRRLEAQVLERPNGHMYRVSESQLTDYRTRYVWGSPPTTPPAPPTSTAPQSTPVAPADTSH